LSQQPDRVDSAIDTQFRQNRAASLIAVNVNTFWSIAVIVLAFAAWDLLVDPAHWTAAFRIRVVGATAIIATGLLQKLPGRAHWMPLMAKIRLILAVLTSMLAALMLDRGYGFAVAGIVAITLTGPYIAIDTRDLRRMNAGILLAVGTVLMFARLSRFDVISTVVFVLLAAVVSTLLGRALDASYRRAFALERQMHDEARTDALTGLANRRAIGERGLMELKRANRSGSAVSVVLGDVDRFKQVNDRFGHDAGDDVLRAIARTLRAVLREVDVLGRWGGEEFLAVLVDTDAQAAHEIAERMRIAVASIPGLPEPATISLGVATLAEVSDPDAAWDSLLQDADRRLYRAKHDGRNRVVSES
jgi:diguanylate cyclase (GGDEF)-like protein